MLDGALGVWGDSFISSGHGTSVKDKLPITAQMPNKGINGSGLPGQEEPTMRLSVDNQVQIATERRASVEGPRYDRNATAVMDRFPARFRAQELAKSAATR
jgi:pantothenate kinase-related protein Tda10